MTAQRAFYRLAEKGRSELWVWVTGAFILLFTFYTFETVLWRAIDWFSSLLKLPTIYTMAVNEFAYDFQYFFGYQLMTWVGLTFPALAAVIFFQKYVRQRPLIELMTAAARFRWKRCFAGLVVGFLVVSVSKVIYFLFNAIHPPTITLSESGPTVLQRGGVSWTFDPSLFFGSLPVLLIFVPMNAVMQESIFRGVIDQGLSRLTGNTVLAFTVSALLFAFWHIQNYEAAFGTPFYLAGMFIFGLAMSIMTYMDNGMEAAIGAHTANNYFFFVIMGMDDPFSLPSWMMSFGEPHSTPGSVFAEIAIWSIALFILSKWVYGLRARS